MIIFWLAFSVIVGVAVYFSKGCAAAFGAIVTLWLGLMLLVLMFSAC